MAKRNKMKVRLQINDVVKYRGKAGVLTRLSPADKDGPMVADVRYEDGTVGKDLNPAKLTFLYEG